MSALAPRSHQSKTIEIGSMRFVLDDYDRAGANRAPLVLLHGAVQSRHVWDAQVETFADERRVVVPDLRGHGETTGPIDDLSIERNADDIVAILDALGIEKAVVCGVSLGGMVALEIAARAPERLQAVVLADTPLALSMTGPIRSLIERLGPHRILWPVFRLIGRRMTARLGLGTARIILGREWVGKEAGDIFVDGFASMSPDAIVATYAAIVASRPIPYETVDLPSLVLLGRHETQLVVSHAGEIARRLGETQIVFVDGGHVPNVDAPKEFNDVMSRFLTKVG